MTYPVTWCQPSWLTARRIKRFLERTRHGKAVLHLGAGSKRIDGAINCDIYDLAADRQLDALHLDDIADDSIDIVEHHHLIEHLAAADLRTALTEWKRVLKPGGLLIVSAPDLETVLERWLAMPERKRWDHGIKMIYGSQEHAGMFHKNGFTSRRLTTILREAGMRPEWSYRGYPRRPTPSFICISRKL